MLLVGKPERKEPLGIPRRKWVDIESWGCVDRIGLAQDMDNW
jgi:hypothetical protein